MVIERKYEWLGILCERDTAVKKLVDEAFKLSRPTAKSKKELLDYNYSNIPAFLNTGCGIPGNTYKYIMDGLEKLDKEVAYDNGLTFKDVTRIEYETSRKGKAIQMRFVSEKDEVLYRIVGFAAIENNGKSVDINEGWEMVAPFVVG